MAIKTTEWIWHNGKLVPWQSATVHVLSHALHYGSSVFEGLRAYSTPTGPQIFRLQAHTRRLLDSAKIHRIEIPWSAAEIDAACKEVVVRNGLKSAYIRPLAYPRLRRGGRRAEGGPPG